MSTSPFSLLPLLAAGSLLAAFATPARAQMDVDPSDLYLKAYLIMRDAQKLEEDVKLDYSYEKYLEATELFDAVARSYPSWNPHMVNFRRKKIREAITALKAKGIGGSAIASGGHGPGPGGERTMPTTAPATPPIPPIGGPGGAPLEPSSYSDDPLPLPRQGPITLVPSRSATPNVIAKIPIESGKRGFSPHGDPSINAATSHIEGKFEELRTRITQLDTEKQNLVYRLEARETDLVKTREDLSKAKKGQEELEEKLAKSQSRLHVNAATGSTEIEDLRTEVALLTAQLKIAKANLSLAGRRTSDLVAELGSATKEIELLKEERSQLIDERYQMTSLLGSIGTDGPHDLSHLMAINANLRRQLETTRESAEKLALERTRDREQITALKAEIAGVTEELQGLRVENESYSMQVAKLTEKLESVSHDLADSGASNAINSEALEENQMLREIILRQLRQQARRQQAKELVMQELAKLEINSKNLFDHIEDLAGTRMVLSDKERALFRDSYVAPLLADSDMHGTLLSIGETSDGDAATKAPPGRVPNSDTKAEIARLSKDASKSFDEEKFEESEALYGDILKLDRQNIYSLCNLGTIKLRLGKHSEAEVLFNKAIAYEPKYARAHFMLGVTFFHEQKLDEALEAITQVVQLDENNAWAHQYLGLIASHKGWVKRAEDEFKKAIAIYPAFAEAHFNLSILYIKSEDSSRDLAEEHYHKALDCGAEPDPVMEEYLRG